MTPLFRVLVCSPRAASFSRRNTSRPSFAKPVRNVAPDDPSPDDHNGHGSFLSRSPDHLFCIFAILDSTGSQVSSLILHFDVEFPRAFGQFGKAFCHWL